MCSLFCPISDASQRYNSLRTVLPVSFVFVGSKFLHGYNNMDPGREEEKREGEREKEGGRGKKGKEGGRGKEGKEGRGGEGEGGREGGGREGRIMGKGIEGYGWERKAGGIKEVGGGSGKGMVGGSSADMC